MIVRCSNCNSAFAVDDSKVENKKFAFTCPKCATENIIDNRKASAMDDFMPEADLGPGPGAAFADDSVPSFVEKAPASRPEAAPETPDEESGISFDDMDLGMDGEELAGEVSGGVRDALPGQDDISEEALFSDSETVDLDGLTPDAGAPEVPDEITSSSGGPLAEDDSIPDIEGFEGLELSGSEAVSVTADDESMDLDGLDIELQPAEKPAVTPGESGFSLDEDLFPLSAEEEKPATEQELSLEDDLILDDFEPLEEDVRPGKDFGALPMDDEIVAEEVYSRGSDDEDESITIDLDTLDIDIDESEAVPVSKGAAPERGLGDMDFGSPLMNDEPSAAGADSGDEDLSLNMNEFDMDLSDEKEIAGDSVPESAAPFFDREDDEDESITLDLDSLDIPLEESEEVSSGVLLEDDEKLTLDDAGLTLDELTSDELNSATARHEEPEPDDEIHLTIDEIDPSLGVTESGKDIDLDITEADSFFRENERPLNLDDEDLPDIDLEGMDYEDLSGGRPAPVRLGDRMLDLDADEIVSEEEMYASKRESRDIAHNGSVSFSVDYSLRYSRTGAVLRLLGIFLLGMIPHFIVMIIYSLVSMILGFINHLVILSSKQNEEDYSEIIENTVRYILAINTSIIGIVEEMPVFAGRKNIDYSMQMNIIYPVAYSRLLAALRLSVVGIMLVCLPHLLLLALIGCVVPLFYLLGVFSVIFTARMPHMFFDILSRYYRYMARIMAFMTGLVDKYPPFTF